MARLVRIQQPLQEQQYMRNEDRAQRHLERAMRTVRAMRRQLRANAAALPSPRHPPATSTLSSAPAPAATATGGGRPPSIWINALAPLWAWVDTRARTAAEEGADAADAGGRARGEGERGGRGSE